MVLGLPKLPLVQPNCEALILKKHHCQSIPKATITKLTRPLKLVHSDLCRPFPQKPLTGSCYNLTFIDDISRRSWVYFLTTKNETLDSFKHWRSMVEINQISNFHVCVQTEVASIFQQSSTATVSKLVSGDS
jgi:hypothetical protein